LLAGALLLFDLEVQLLKFFEVLQAELVSAEGAVAMLIDPCVQAMLVEHVIAGRHAH